MYACGGPAGARTGRLRAIGGREHGRVLAVSSGRIRGDRHCHQGNLERRRCRLTSPGRIRSSRLRPEHHFRASPSTVGAIRLHDYWTVGIVAFNSDSDLVTPYGCYAFRAGCGIGTPTFNHRTTVPLYNRARFRFETRCGAPGGCPTTASGFTPGNRALFSAANVSVRVDDWTTPALTPHSGALWRTGWHRGHEEAATSLHGQRRDHGDAHDCGRRAARRPGLSRRAAGRPGCDAISPARGHASTLRRAGSG